MILKKYKDRETGDRIVARIYRKKEASIFLVIGKTLIPFRSMKLEEFNKNFKEVSDAK